ncbi:MAG: PEP-CTERM sorting domain-containing protein [Phycisphaerae bacterium]|jgi:hypothetical protein
MKRQRSILWVALFGALVALASVAQAGTVAVYGSPLHDPVTNSEFGTGAGTDGYAPYWNWVAGISDSGVAVGTVDGPYNGDLDVFSRSAVRWDSTGAQTVLGNLGVNSVGFPSSGADAIDRTGNAVGWSQTFDAGDNATTHTVRWDVSSTTPTVLSETPSGYGYSTSNTNSAGTTVSIVGKYDKDGNWMGTRGMRQNAGDPTPTELSGVIDVGFSWARAINEAGIIVGGICNNYSWNDTDNPYGSGDAVYWDANGVPVDLNTLIDPNSGWMLADATAISDTDWVAGWGFYTDPNGDGSTIVRLYSLQIPEPATMTLLALGALALLRKHRRLDDGR